MDIVETWAEWIVILLKENASATVSDGRKTSLMLIGVFSSAMKISVLWFQNKYLSEKTLVYLEVVAKKDNRNKFQGSMWIWDALGWKLIGYLAVTGQTVT